QREAVLALAADAELVGEVLGGLATRVSVAAPLHQRVDDAPAQHRVLHHQPAAGTRSLGISDRPRRAAHRLHAAGEDDLSVAHGDRAGRLRDGLQPGAAQAVDGHAGDLDRQVGQQRRHAGDVAAVLTRLVAAAEDHVLDVPAGHAAALDRGADDVGREVVGPDAAQRPAEASHRRAHRFDDPRLGHVASLRRTRRTKSPSWTTSSRWLRTSTRCTMTPRSGLLVSRSSVMVVITLMVSPMRTGARKRQLRTSRNPSSVPSKTPPRWRSPVAIASTSTPWAIRSPYGVRAACSASVCSGLKSPETPAKFTTSASVTVRPG